MTTARTPSYGEKAVDLTSNPSNSAAVDAIKRRFADVIDMLDILRGTTNSAEKKRVLSVAITEAQTAQMWAVKAVTGQY